MPAGLFIWAVNVNLFVKNIITASCLGEEGEVLASMKSAGVSPGKAQSSDVSSQELEGLWPRKSRKISPHFFCCLLDFKTVQKDFSLWKGLAVVFSRVHILRTSSLGLLIDRPLRYCFWIRNFNIFPSMLCHFEKEKL